MDGYPSKLAGELHTYNYSSGSQHFNSASTGISTPVQSMSSTTPYMAQQTHSSSQLESNTAAPGTSLQDDFSEGSSVGGGGGRKKKKKQKSGEDPGTSVKPNMLAEEELADPAVPLLTENQGVEDLLFPASLPPPGGTLVGGQYMLNNSLLDQILTEKKMQILQSPEVIEFLKKQMAKK
ncbi:uncharacterized protein LOC121855203 [Homarus americanus]|uniref:Putative Regulatory factor X-associated C-terminal binding domain-containing protein n=1 Tax=Homarus americanus TaxID=6706 RepID=A0A8J5N910_HOMAM|nr:uncharacterized protein LOC121855203 [Homarus americanus]KAG7175750.1 putative Regulatory factor X-associated C-terminal binding domain-containing protein [Homarus americanus]